MKFGVGVFLTLSFLLGNNFVAAQASDAAPRPAAVIGEQEERNKALARRFYEQIWFSRNLSAVDELVAPSYVVHDIGDRKGATEPADEQKQIADFFWQHGTMTGRIDYQIAEGDLVATRWQWEFQPRTWWMKALGGRSSIPIINVFRFRDGKIVEIWNHRHDIDTGAGNMLFVEGLLVGLVPSLVLLVVSLLLWRRLRKQSKVSKLSG
jgi:predicted SnoaL-like aldol condensation-catalyzing enzyme